jgi:hypothetical protein
VVAESVLVKQQLLILNRSRQRSPNLRVSDRIVAGLCALLMRPGRMIRSAIVFKPSTLLSLHRALTHRKYRRLFSSNVVTKPGPQGPYQEVIAAVVNTKRRNPTWAAHGLRNRSPWRSPFPSRRIGRRILAVRYRIVGFGVHRGVVDGVGLCRMFNRATRDLSSPQIPQLGR